MEKHQKWLTATAKYFNIPEETILDCKQRNWSIVKARKTFYYLCFKDGMDLYRLSEHLGKERTSIITSMYSVINRDVEAERSIRSSVVSKCPDEEIGRWMERGEIGENIAIGLIASKQIANLECEFL